MQLSLIGLLAGLLIAAAAGDLRSRLIPNRINAAVALLAILWWIVCGLGASAITLQLGIALITFTLFAGLFALGWMGGGDVKLIGALALWLPGPLLLRTLVWMVLAGGLLSLMVLIHHRWHRRTTKAEVPYGVAIAAATLLALTNDLLTIRAA